MRYIQLNLPKHNILIKLMNTEQEQHNKMNSNSRTDSQQQKSITTKPHKNNIKANNYT